MAKDAALVEEATRLAVDAGYTVEQISELMPNVSKRTLNNWSAKYNWPKRRELKRQHEQDIEAYTLKIKLRLAKFLAEEEEPDHEKIQWGYALARGIAVLTPPAAIELRKIEKAEKEAESLSPEEKRQKVKEAIAGVYGIAV